MKPARRLRILLAVLLAAPVLGWVVNRSEWYRAFVADARYRSAVQAARQHRPDVEARLRPYFARAGVSFPPEHVALLVFKLEQRLELWSSRDARWVLVRSYPVLGPLGRPGPRLVDADDHAPEGVYRVLYIDPNSDGDVAMYINFPNDLDRDHCLAEGRPLFNHFIAVRGKDSSRGSIAVGPEAIEDLLVLTLGIGRLGIRVIIAPADLRDGGPAPTHPRNPPWTPDLYRVLRKHLSWFKRQ